MKNSKSRNDNRKYLNDYDDDEVLAINKKESRRRRPVRNWTKAWVEHEKDYDERDDFFGK